MADLEKKDEKTRQWRSYSCSQLSAFCLQISLLLEAAVPLDEGFSIMAEDAEDENEKKTDIEKIIVDNKTVIYSIVFYACSLAIGTVLYRLLQSSALDSVLKPSNANFSKLFSQNICNYLSLFLITVFLAFCLIGYGLINIIPCVIGIQVGMKAAYFYINYQAKGVGYTILMIAPFAALFLTVLIFVIQTSSNMSKQIVDITKNNLDYKLEVKPTLRKFLIYGLIIIAFSGVCALIETLLKSVVTI